MDTRLSSVSAKRRISGDQLIYQCKHLFLIGDKDRFHQAVFMTEFTVKTGFGDFSAPTNLIHRDAVNVFPPVRLHSHSDYLFAIQSFWTPS